MAAFWTHSEEFNDGSTRKVVMEVEVEVEVDAQRQSASQELRGQQRTQKQRLQAYLEAQAALELADAALVVGRGTHDLLAPGGCELFDAALLLLAQAARRSGASVSSGHERLSAPVARAL